MLRSPWLIECKQTIPLIPNISTRLLSLTRVHCFDDFNPEKTKSK